MRQQTERTVLETKCPGHFLLRSAVDHDRPQRFILPVSD